jgi:DNA polymerase I
MSATSPLKPGDHLYLIDGSGYIFRAYHALPPLTRKSDGLPVGAVQGFCNMLWKLLKETNAGHRPTHLAVIFDHSSKSFRNDIYPQYKAQRPDPPADLRPQFGLIRQATRAFNVACVEQENYEADDLIATYARQAVEAGATCRIVSSDKDLMQLIRPGVALYDTMKDREVGEPEVLEKFGVTPDKVIDIQSLAGDSVDNVPGVPGIGVKTAAQLLTEYGDLETLLARAPEIKQQKRRENLIQFAEQARISKRLVTLDDHVPVTHDVGSFAVDTPRASDLIGFTKALEFSTFTKKVAGELDCDASAIDPVPVEVKFWPPEGMELPPTAATPKASPEKPAGEAPAAAAGAGPTQAEASLLAIPFTHADYETVTSLSVLKTWADAASETGYIALDTETDSLDSMRANLVGVSLATAPGRACYIPLQHKATGGGLFGGETLEGQIPLAEAIAVLKPLLEDPSILKVGQNLKYDIEVLKRHGMAVTPIDDTMLMSYVLESGDVGHGMDELAKRHLNHTCIAFKDVAGSGKSMITFDRVPVADATRYAAEDADVTLRLWLLLKPRLAAMGKRAVYETLERPLVSVLAAMEMEGILIDPEILRRLSNELATAAAAIEIQVHQLAGERFNIGSPKQLGDILFGRMGLPGGRKTQTGAWSTDSDALEDLAAQGIELARRVLDWRQLSKLRSTYTDALPNFINPETKRVHTSTRWRRPPRAGSPPPSPTCRTFRSARRRAARSAPPSSRLKARSSSAPTTARSSCAWWPMWRTFRS